MTSGRLTARSRETEGIAEAGIHVCVRDCEGRIKRELYAWMECLWACCFRAQTSHRV